jgi:O-antigen/teichoic acid export membrane protein
MPSLIQTRGIRDYLTITSGVLGRLAVSLVYFLIVANSLSLADFGIFATASALGLVLSRVLAFGFISPVYRVATVKRRLLGTYCSGLLGLGLLSLPLIMLLAAILHGLFFTETIGLALFLIIILAEVLGWRIVEYVSIINNGLNRFAIAAWIVIGGSSLRTLAAILFWSFGSNSLDRWVWFYAAATLASAALALLFGLPRMRLRWKPRLYTMRMKDAFTASGSEILFYLQSELDKLLVLTLAGPAAAGLYAIAMRIIDLTAIPVRSFNQLIVQKLMRAKTALHRNRRITIEAAIAIVSIGGLIAVIVLLLIWPAALGKNVATAGALFPYLLLVPAFRNLTEYHSELIYAAEMGGRRIIHLLLLALLRLGGIAVLIVIMATIETWAIWLNPLYAASYGVSLVLLMLWLPANAPAKRPAGSDQPRLP